MPETKTIHTPGPWKAVEHKSVTGDDYIQILAGSWDIAHNKYSARNWDEERANAALIAACPDMLAALEGLLSIESSVTQGQERELREEWIPKARLALAKAHGATNDAR